MPSVLPLAFLSSNTPIIHILLTQNLYFCASARFILSFFPLDDTIAIFEPKQPNSGLLGGTFLERTKVSSDPLLT